MQTVTKDVAEAARENPALEQACAKGRQASQNRSFDEINMVG